MTWEEVFWPGAAILVAWWLWTVRREASRPRPPTIRSKISRETFRRGEPTVPSVADQLVRRRHGKRGQPGGAYPYWWSDMLRAYDYTCVYCGFQSYPKATGRARLHEEHDVPLARGGRHHVDNIRPACGRCNLVKGTLTGAEFEQVILDNGGVVPKSRAKTSRVEESRPRAPTQRQQILMAVAALQRLRPDQASFTVAEIVTQLRMVGCEAPLASLRATIATMGTTGALSRVDRGRYRLPPST